MLCDYGVALQVLKINATDGRPILAPTLGLPVRSLLFIGASLVSGFSPLFSNVLPRGSFQAFASVAVRSLYARGVDVRLEMVAYPGLRLTSTEYEKGMEDVFWEGRDGVGGWQTRSQHPPDDIFLCLGTNDRAWGEDKDTFLQCYKAFLIRLRDAYQDACRRIHVISPFGVFHDVRPTIRRTVYEPHVQHMIEALAQSWTDSEPDGVQLYHVSTEGWIDKSLTCDNLHPTVEGHQIIGEKLVEFLDAKDLA